MHPPVLALEDEFLGRATEEHQELSFRRVVLGFGAGIKNGVSVEVTAGDHQVFDVPRAVLVRLAEIASHKSVSVVADLNAKILASGGAQAEGAGGLIEVGYVTCQRVRKRVAKVALVLRVGGFWA